jgi:hypothetical protein
MEEPQTAGSQSGGTQILLPAFLQPSLSCNNKTKFSNFEGLFSNKVHKKERNKKYSNPTSKRKEFDLPT